MKKMEKKVKMYKAKHGLILETKYLIWSLIFGKQKRREEKRRKEEKKRRRRRRREEKKRDEERRKDQKEQRYGIVWITMGLYGFLWLGMTILLFQT